VDCLEAHIDEKEVPDLPGIFFFRTEISHLTMPMENSPNG
jgi:hypothetical protein